MYFIYSVVSLSSIAFSYNLPCFRNTIAKLFIRLQPVAGLVLCSLIAVLSALSFDFSPCLAQSLDDSVVPATRSRL
jgi:hypothetical protein